MIKKLINLSQRDFSRNLTLVFGGALGAQLITFAINPVLTRLYGPDAFGLFSTIFAIAMLIAPIATLTYPVAITLPKKKSEAKKITTISFCLAILISITIIPLILLTKHQISTILNIQKHANYLLLVPAMIFFLAFVEISQQWTIRERRFSLIANVTFTHSIIVNLLKVIAGFLYPYAITLLYISIFSSALNALMLTTGQIQFKRIIKNRASKFSLGSLIKIAKQYEDFPIFRMPQVFVLSFSQNLPLLLLASLSSIAFAGQYGLARSVMAAPAILLGNSLASVFYPRINKAVVQGENLTKLIKKATLALCVVGVLPFGVLFFTGPWLFALLFGETWRTAGIYASWLAVLFYFSLLSKPALTAATPLKLQKIIFYYELVSMLLKLASFLAGILILSSPEKAIMFFSIAGAVSYLFITLWIINKSKSSNN